MKKTTLWILIGAFLALISVVAVAGAAYALWQSGPGRPAGPEVLIRAPSLGDQVAIGRNTLVQAIATDVDGVTRVELWADGQLVDLDETSLPAGSTPMPFLSDWQPDSAGAHTLVVRAYDSRRNSGQASVIVTAGEEPAPAAYVVGEADSGELPPNVLEAIAEEHPGLAAAMESGDVGLSPVPVDTEEGGGTPPEGETLEPLEGEGPPDPFPGEEMPGLLQRLLGLSTGTFQMPASWLEVEALSLEVDKEYDGVYCYVALGDQGAERLPADGYVPAMGGDNWDIAAIMGGENRRAVLYPEAGAPLDVVVSCLGINESSSGAGVSFDLGTLTTAHLPSDWDGRRLEHWVMGPAGWFRLAYRITRAGLEGIAPSMHGPTGLSKHCFENMFLNTITCVLSWYFPEDYLNEISGYIVVRNDDFYLDLPLGVPAADTRELPLFEGDGIPACGQRYEYQVIAYQGDLIAGPRSMPSNSLVLEGEACPGRGVTVTFETLNTVCLTGDCVENPFELDTEGRYLPPDGPLNSTGCDRGRGCEGGESYATLWANEHAILLGGMNDMGIVYDWRCGGIYSIADMITFGESNPLHLDLTPFESLEISMRLYDFDAHSGDDLQCAGGVLLSPDDLRATFSMPGHRQSLTRAFNQEGGGACYLVFTVEVAPIITPPEYEPREPMGSDG